VECSNYYDSEFTQCKNSISPPVLYLQVSTMHWVIQEGVSAHPQLKRRLHAPIRDNAL
jgi:hypothetical protein